MFDGLSDRLSGIFDKLTGRGALKEEDVTKALREVRIALLEADVALPVVKDFIARVKERAVGAEVLKSVTPGQQVVKIVHDNLVEMLGETSEGISVHAAPPAPILMVGLQGSGKTTSTAKIAKRLKEKEGKRVLMASLDTRRPAAMQQLAILGEQIGVDTVPIVDGQTPVQIAKRALSIARMGNHDIMMLDTAGRLAIDEALMAEITAVKHATNPVEVLLVADAMTGQDAVTVAQNFDQAVGVTGIVLTRVDGDSRGGAALSMRAVTGKPIKMLGVGEKLDAVEPFHPDRVAGRILGMGDIVSLVEKAAEQVDQDNAEAMAKKLMKGQFTLEDMKGQLEQVTKMGGLGGIMGMLPGVAKVKDQLAAAGMDDSLVKRQIAIIQSMTPQERREVKVLNGSRKRRIAMGSGTSVPEVNRLLKQHKQMQEMTAKLRKGGKKGMMRQMQALMSGGGMQGGMPGLPAPKMKGVPKGFTPPGGWKK